MRGGLPILGGTGDYRNKTYNRFVELGFEKKKAWQLTNRVRKYICAYAHFFPVEANEKGDTVETLLVALWYKFAYEEYKKSTENIFPSQRSAAFQRAVATLEAPIRRVLTKYTWADKPLRDVRETWKIESFPDDFKTFWKALFTKIDEDVEAAIKTEEEANRYFKNKGIKIQPETETYINAVAALRAALRREVFRQ